jgi:hypothetical protein
MVEVEVREHDLELADAVEQGRIGEQAACAGADVE